MNWKTVIIAIFGMGAVIAIIHPSSLETPEPAPAPAAKTVVIKQTAAQQPDGYISEEQCARIATGMPVADLVWKFGWPANDYPYGYERFFYPVHDRGEDRCVVETDDNKVVSALYQDR